MKEPTLEARKASKNEDADLNHVINLRQICWGFVGAKPRGLDNKLSMGQCVASDGRDECAQTQGDHAWMRRMLEEGREHGLIWGSRGRMVEEKSGNGKGYTS